MTLKDLYTSPKYAQVFMLGAFFLVLGGFMGVVYSRGASWSSLEQWLAALIFSGICGICLSAGALYRIRSLSKMSPIVHYKGYTVQSKPLIYSLCVAGGYAVIGCVYVLFSTQLMHALAETMDHLKSLTLIKGYFYVILTSLVLFIFAYALFQRTTRDSQELLMQKEALVEASKRATTGVFAASIAHDAGNILASLRFCVELLGRSRVLTGNGAELLENMQRAVGELSALNRRLLATGQRGLVSELVMRDLIPEIKGTLGLIRLNQRAKYCQITLEGAETLHAMVNPSLINEMLVNLILNAADATENRGKIAIYAYCEGDQVHLEVHDNGPGIPAEDMSRIFEPFYSTKSHGTGLGLLTVKACVELHHGTLRIDRSPVQGGALFAITFPRGS